MELKRADKFRYVQLFPKMLTMCEIINNRCIQSIQRLIKKLRLSEVKIKFKTERLEY